jgi:hypothetical protein
MDPTTSVEPTAGARATSSAPGHRAPFLKEARLLWHDLRGLVHDHFELAALETQRAGESLVAMVVAGMLVAGLLLSAWLGLMGATVLALTSNGVMTTGSALLVEVAVNLLVALVLWRVIARLSHRLRFPANARSLQPASPEFPDREPS